jgi:hypothetical protein
MTQRIIVCGIYKSGTSLTTKLLNAWGAYMGKEEDLFQGDNGCVEHYALQRLNDELLTENDRVPTPVENLLEKAKDSDLVQRAHQLLVDMDREAQASNAAVWVWKDPRLPMALPFWANVWQDVIYVIPVRHPVETIQSGAKMEGLNSEQVPLSAGLAYWQFCMLNILNFTQTSARKIFVAYDQLVQNPEKECARLSQFLDAQCGIEGNPAQRIEKMAGLITSSKHHFQYLQSLSETGVSTTEQRALYNFLRVKTAYPDESFNPNDFALYPGWLEYLQMMDTLVSAMESSQEN